MSHRIFIAVSASEKLRREIEEWESGWQTLPVRWLAGKNLHITLVPPWYVDDVGEVKSSLDAWAKINSMQPFYIQFQSVSFGPDPMRPRLIWASGETPRELIELKSGVEKALDQEPERRDFKLHLTLARFREEDFSAFPAKTLNEIIDWEEEIKSFVLMESHLSRSGADYEVLSEWEFHAPSS